MKILLANPSYKQSISQRYERYYIRSGSRWPHSGVKIKGQVPHYLPFPFFLAYAAALLKESAFDVYVIDAVALDISEEDFLYRIQEIRPDVVFYEVVTPTFNYDLFLAKRIKKLIGSTIIIAGTDATVFASQILNNNTAVDFILKGEYEWSLRELLKAIRAGNVNLPSGVVFRSDKNIIDNGYSCSADSLDRLPYPLRDIFPSNDSSNPTVYWDGFCQKYPAIQMQSSRGCFYNCYFCLWKNVLYRGNEFRAFSPPRVVDEMQNLINKYKVQEIYFDDDDFTADRGRVFSLCHELVKRNMDIKWSCMVNIANLTEIMIETMAKSGCIGIKFGIESGSRDVLKKIGKPLNLQKVTEIIKFCRKYKIKTHASFTIGHWEETEKDIEKTERLTRILDIDSIQVSIVIPYPGTEFYAVAKKKGIIKDIDCSFYDGKNTKVAYYSLLNINSLNEIRKRLISIWFLKRLLSPVWCIKHSWIILRTITGLGIVFFFKQCRNVIIDEYKNKAI